MTYVLIAVALLLLAEKAWKHLMIVRFFRRKQPVTRRPPQLVSILQPILSGDPTLPTCLECNLQVSSRYAREFLWLVDETDLEGQAICRELIARYPGQTVRLMILPPPTDRCSPKMLKLLAAIPQARGDVLCVLDDDTMLPEGGLEECLPYLDGEGVGLAFGLPYYVSFGNVWSRLVAYFVNSHSLLTYIPYTYLVEPFTINGMFYVFRRDVYEATGGFAGLETILADDFAVARHFRRRGYRLAQTPVRHGISTHVTGPGAYFRLIHRWFVFSRETLLKMMPWSSLVLTLIGVSAPLFLLICAVLAEDWWVTGLTAVYLVYHYAIFAHFNVAYLRRAVGLVVAGGADPVVPAAATAGGAALTAAHPLARARHADRARRRFPVRPAEDRMSGAMRRNLCVMIPCALLQTAAYSLLNHYPLFAPQRLPLTAVDEAVPFWTWTVWPYLLLLVLGPLLPLMVRDELVFRRLFLAYLLAIPATFTIFFVFPTEYMRPPVPTDESLTSSAYRLLIAVDTEGCCFPSGHIVVPVLFGVGVWLEGRRVGVWVCGLVALLAPTILTTKQHYVWDLLGALVIVAGSLAIAYCVMRQRSECPE